MAGLDLFVIACTPQLALDPSQIYAKTKTAICFHGFTDGHSNHQATRLQRYRLLRLKTRAAVHAMSRLRLAAMTSKIELAVNGSKITIYTQIGDDVPNGHQTRLVTEGRAEVKLLSSIVEP